MRAEALRISSAPSTHARLLVQNHPVSNTWHFIKAGSAEAGPVFLCVGSTRNARGLRITGHAILFAWESIRANRKPTMMCLFGRQGLAWPFCHG
jgi:hypothetical protein